MAAIACVLHRDEEDRLYAAAVSGQPPVLLGHRTHPLPLFVPRELPADAGEPVELGEEFADSAGAQVLRDDPAVGST